MFSSGKTKALALSANSLMRVAGNGQVIGQSQMYADAGGRDNGIRSVMENAPGATLDDTTD